MENQRTAAASVEADHLRRLIETQPAVLMRVGLDGTILAANDAALGLLGAEELNQLSGLMLSACIAPEHSSRWSAFSAAIAQATSNSFECDFTNLVGTTRHVVFHGIPVLDHHDGVASTILSAQDRSPLQWSQAVVENSEPRPQHSVEQAELAQAQQGRLEQLDRLLRDGRNHLLRLRSKLERQTDETRALAATLAEREASLEQSNAARAALADGLAAKDRENAELSTALAEHDRLAAEAARDRVEREQRAQQELEKVTAERNRLADRLDTRERQLQELMEKHDSLEDRLRTALAEHASLETLLNARAADMDALKAAHKSITAERDDLQVRMDCIAVERREWSAQLEEAKSGRQQAEDALSHARMLAREILLSWDRHHSSSTSGGNP